LKAKCTDAMLLTNGKPHGQEPSAKRFSGSFKYCSSSGRCLPLATPTMQQPAPRVPCRSLAPAMRAAKPLRPAQFAQEIATCSLRSKPHVELLKCPRVVLPAHRPFLDIHVGILHLVGTGVKWIPTIVILSPEQGKTG
jgi:hypothetical protein